MSTLSGRRIAPVMAIAIMLLSGGRPPSAAPLQERAPVVGETLAPIEAPITPAPVAREGKPKPPAAAPAVRRENYRIGPGDVVEIRVLGQDQMSTPSARVQLSGYIQAPFVDEDIRAQCMTERELGAEIARRLKKYLKYPEVHVAVKEYNSTPVSIIGAVAAPGRFMMQRQVSLLELVTFAGGIQKGAGQTLHVIHAADEQSCDADAVAATPVAATAGALTTETISVVRLLEGDSTQNRLMRPGDIVVVPVADLIFVAGEVLKPNSYPLTEGLTLTQALALAGGPSQIAKKGAIRIVRQEAGKEKVEIKVDLDAIQKNKAEDPLLMANDVVEVPNSAGKTFFRNFMGAIGGSAGNLPIRAIP